LLLGYNRFAGLRRDAKLAEVAIDSVEEMGLGLLLSASLLLLLGRIHAALPINEIMGQIVIEAMPVAIGISVGTAQLGGGDGQQDDSGMEGGEDRYLTPGLGQAMIALCGAVLFASNVAPTEEVMMLAVESSPWHILAMAIVSIILGALILNFSEFRGAQQFARAGNTLELVGGIAQTYATALFASAVLLWFFGRFDGASLPVCVAQTVVLGLAATLGASAGRLLLQANQGGEDESE
jgi:putative integral membrane protein (TIGR02587 family)